MPRKKKPAPPQPTTLTLTRDCRGHRYLAKLELGPIETYETVPDETCEQLLARLIQAWPSVLSTLKSDAPYVHSVLRSVESINVDHGTLVPVFVLTCDTYDHAYTLSTKWYAATVQGAVQDVLGCCLLVRFTT
jgi:hypothetical protein